MRTVILCLVVAFVVPSYGLSLTSRRVNWKSLMYSAGGTVQCDVCEMVVGDVQSLLKGQETEIENLLDSLCQDLPSAYRANCTSIVDAYLPIFFALINDMTPEEVCELLTLCTTNTDISELNSRRSPVAFLSNILRSASQLRALKDRRISYMRRIVGEDYLCEACEDTIGFIHEAVACNYTWNMVAEFFSPLCEICPLKDSCYRFFNELPGDVNDFANKYLDPIQDCEVFGFCRQELTEYIEEIELVTEVGEIEPEVEETEPEVEEEVDTVAPRRRVDVDIKKKLYNAREMKKLAKQNKKNLKNINKLGQRRMDNFRRRAGRAIIVSIGGREDVNEIPYDVMQSDSGYQEVPEHKKCEVCRYFSAAAEGVLQYNAEDITNGLTIIMEDICNIMPTEWQAECNTEIKDVLPGIIYQAAMTMMNPDHLCIEVIGICQ